MENDLVQRGYTELCLGVKSKRVRNMQIYFNWGFVNYIRTNPDEDMTNYYYKIIKEWYVYGYIKFKNMAILY